jgi:hypothetical protein
MTSKIIMTYEHCPVKLCNLRDDFSIPLFTTRGVKSLLFTGVGSNYIKCFRWHFIHARIFNRECERTSG